MDDGHLCRSRRCGKTTKRASHSFPNSLVTELLGDDTVIGDPLVVKAYQERMSDYTVNSYQVRQGKTETTANSDACLMLYIILDSIPHLIT